MDGFPILSVMLAVPMLAAIVCLFLDAPGARMLALAATLIDLALGALLWANFDIGGAQWQFTENASLFGGIDYALGIDGMLGILAVIPVIAAMTAITSRLTVRRFLRKTS